MKTLFTIFGVLLISSVVSSQKTVKLSIFYETLCPDSIRFFRYQLSRTYEKIGSFLDIDLVPYGLASHDKVNGRWSFLCQHGSNECRGNKFHACQLAQNNTAEATHVKFVVCSMRRFDPTSAIELEKCAKKMGIDFDSVKKCVENGIGDELLVKYGERTKAVIPKIRYIPTIIINDVYNKSTQDKAETDLLETMCENLDPKPAVCPSRSSSVQ